MSTDPKPKYEFDGAFQKKLAALCIRDISFVRRTDGLVKPEYFEDNALGFLVDQALTYYEQYGELPDNTLLQDLTKSKFRSNPKLAVELGDDVVTAIFDVEEVNLSGANYVAAQVSDFALYQEVSDAVVGSIDSMEDAMLTGNRDLLHDSIKKIIAAAQTGLHDDLVGVDYFNDIDKRTEHREALESGKIERRGITTGIRRVDKLLKHRGYGRGELSVIMAFTKMGKSACLADAAKSAALDGHNVLVATLEMGADIYSDRIDANISGTNMDDLERSARAVQSSITSAGSGAGLLKIHSFPSNSLTISALKRLISRYRSQGIVFDEIVVDYADIMKPEDPRQERRHQLSNIYLDLRAIGQEEDAAMLTATQTNRDGAKQLVADSTNVAEDIGKVQHCDLLISLNKTEEEAAMNKARFYFAASRNQAGNFSVHVEQDMAKMRPINRVVDVI